MDQVESAKFATKFDLLKGYLQVLLTAMTVVMEFGLRNTATTFQRRYESGSCKFGRLCSLFGLRGDT